jgi:hypothetical protein
LGINNLKLEIMKRSYYLFIAFLTSFLFQENAFAGKKTLLEQTYELSPSIDWISPTLGTSAFTIGNANENHFLQFTQSGNDRSAHYLWNVDYANNTITDNSAYYHVEFAFNIVSAGNAHRTSEFTVMSDAVTCTKKPNANFIANSHNWLFDLSETSAGSQYAPVFSINGEQGNTISLTAGTWYNVILDVKNSVVDYRITNSSRTETFASGSYTIPAGTTKLATGIYALAGRYMSAFEFDNISVSAETDGDYANDPVTTLKKIDGTSRTYSISFHEEDTLHYNFAGEGIQTIHYTDCSGESSFSTSKSGTLLTWTTSGMAKSNVISTDIDASNVVLPAVSVTIDSIAEGYVKAYKLFADSSLVLTQPVLTVGYEFASDDGTKNFSSTNLKNGTIVTVPSKGKLTIHALADGFTESTTSIDNNVEYVLNRKIDLAHLEKEDISAAGFTDGGMVTNDFASDGFIYGYDADGKSVSYRTIPQYTRLTSAFTSANDYVVYGSVKSTTILPVNAHILPGIGLCIEGQKGDNANGTWLSNAVLYVSDMSDKDYAVVYRMSNYGADTEHPVVADVDELVSKDLAQKNYQTVNGQSTFELYRVSSAISRIEIFSPKEISGITIVPQDVNQTKSSPIYTIMGVRVNENHLTPGVYVRKGKVFIVK